MNHLHTSSNPSMANKTFIENFDGLLSRSNNKYDVGILIIQAKKVNIANSMNIF